MDGYDYDRPYVSQKDMGIFVAVHSATAAKYGSTVRAIQRSNVDYKMRFARFGRERNMMPPPSCGRIFIGYIVVRNIDTPDQYETWMPDDVFDELYRTA